MTADTGSWTALMPLADAGARKSRLSGLLDATARDELALAMARRVMAALADCPAIGPIIVLSASPPPLGAVPACMWRRDEGRGLNAELAATIAAWHAQAGGGAAGILICHADLPLLTAHDLAALIEAATGDKGAIAGDACGTGTNALALPAGLVAGGRFVPAFGPDSFARHRALLEGLAIVSGREGLALDVDTAADLALARAAGFVPDDPLL